MRVNSTGVFLASQIFSEPMQAQRSGSIINISSIYGVVGPDFSIYEGTSISNPVNYSFAKSGIIGLTRYLASFLGPFGVRVNCLTPGGIWTTDTPEIFVKHYSRRTMLGRMAVPEDMMGAALFLASGARLCLCYGTEYSCRWRVDLDLVAGGVIPNASGRSAGVAICCSGDFIASRQTARVPSASLRVHLGGRHLLECIKEIAGSIEMPGVALAESCVTADYTVGTREKNMSCQQIRSQCRLASRDVAFASDTTVGGVEMDLSQQAARRTQPQIGNSFVGDPQIRHERATASIQPQWAKYPLQIIQFMAQIENHPGSRIREP